MITILYRPNSDHERDVLEFQRGLVKDQVAVRMINIDSREGTSLASLYDITKYPGVLATQSDGRIIQSWQGTLPTLSDVSFFAHA